MEGDTGAIIGSRNSIYTTTTVHDNRETVILIKKNEQEASIFFEPDFYNILMHQIPSREITYISKNITKDGDNNNLDRLIQLGEIKDKGHISQEEFEKLKKELIN